MPVRSLCRRYSHSSASLARLFANLKHVDGSIRIQYNGKGLDALDWLGGLTCVTHDLYINSNPFLRSLSGLAKTGTLVIGGTLSISSNARLGTASLADTAPLPSMLNVAGPTYVSKNPLLKEFMATGRTVLRFSGGLRIQGNPLLARVATSPHRFAVSKELHVYGNPRLGPGVLCRLVGRCRSQRVDRVILSQVCLYTLLRAMAREWLTRSFQICGV